MKLNISIRNATKELMEHFSLLEEKLNKIDGDGLNKTVRVKTEDGEILWERKK